MNMNKLMGAAAIGTTPFGAGLLPSRSLAFVRGVVFTFVTIAGFAKSPPAGVPGFVTC